MIRKRHIGLAGIGIAAFIVAGTVLPVAAMQETEQAQSELRTNVTRGEVTERLKGKLDDTKKRICNARTNAIKTIMTHAGEAGQRNLNTFNAIQNRVTDFYTKKQLNVTNYTALKSAADAKYAAAVSAVNAVKNSPAFECGSDDPIGAADQFKAKVKTMHDALKDYRSSVLALLHAVKTAAKAAEGGA